MMNYKKCPTCDEYGDKEYENTCSASDTLYPSDTSDQFKWDEEGLCSMLNTLDATGSDQATKLALVFKALTKNSRGDIIAGKTPKGQKAPSYIVNPFTNEKVPVYSEEEKDLLEELYELEEQLVEVEGWYEAERDARERVQLRRDMDYIEDRFNKVKDKLDDMREEDEWDVVRQKQKKLAEEKEKVKKKKATATKKKKTLAKNKEDKRIAKVQAERQADLDAMPDDLRDAADDLFN